MANLVHEGVDENIVNLKNETDSLSADEDSSDSPGESSSVGCGNLKKGPWTPAEDVILVDYVNKHGEGNWNAVQKHSGLSRCGKSCRLRWANHLRPNLKKGPFTPEEEQKIIELHSKLGNKWAKMAMQLPGRTDNEIKNYWNTRTKRLQRAGLPLYPPNLSSETSKEKPDQNGKEFGTIDRWKDEFLRPNGCDIPDVIFDNFKASQEVLSFVPSFPGIPIRSILSQGLGQSNFGLVPPTRDWSKRMRESAEFLSPGFHGVTSFDPTTVEHFAPPRKIHRPFGVDLPYDPDPGNRSLIPESQAAVISDSIPLSDNFSASQVFSASVKIELPSFQHPVDGLGIWSSHRPALPLEPVNAVSGAPSPTASVKSSIASLEDSELLDALFHNSQGMCNAETDRSKKSSGSSIVLPSDLSEISAYTCSKTECAGFPMIPLCYSATAGLKGCDHLATGTAVCESSSPDKTSTRLNIEDEPPDNIVSKLSVEGSDVSPHFDLCASDELLGLQWWPDPSNDQTTPVGGEMAALGEDTLVSLLGDELCGESWRAPADVPPSSSSFEQELEGFSACAWSGVQPPVCQMSELG